MPLEKGKLIKVDGDGADIVFMFNPTEISFSRTSNWSSDPGNRGDELLPKVNFAGVEPYKFTISKLLFDTYETKESVITKYIENIKKGVTAPTGQNNRPPVYVFTWRDEYFHCVMTSLTYTLTMFLSDGTPVRASVDITLQEVDKNNPPGGRQAPTTNGSRQEDSRVTSTTS
jgi:hypothetical protein